MITEPLRIGNYQKLEPLSRQLTNESYQKLEPLRRTSQNAERAKTAFEDEIRTEFSSLMKKEATAPLESGKSEMTFWSRYDAVANHKGNTDHWTKLKQRAVQVRSLENPDAIGKPITLALVTGSFTCTSCGFRVARWLGVCSLCYHSNKLRTWFPVPDGKHTRLPYGRVQNLSEKLFDDFIIDALQGNMPGTYMYTRPRNSPARDSLRNSFNDRAKEGFRYWLIDRPKPTSFGKYGIGSYKTVLGVGNAPRT